MSTRMSSAPSIAQDREDFRNKRFLELGGATLGGQKTRLHFPDWIAGQNIHARPYVAIARLKSAPLKNKSEEIVDELRRRFETLEKP